MPKKVHASNQMLIAKVRLDTTEIWPSDVCRYTNTVLPPRVISSALCTFRMPPRRKLVTPLPSVGGGGESLQSRRKHSQKAPEDVAFIREKTYTLPITLARGLRIRARTRRGKKRRRKEKPGGVPTHSRRSFPFQGTLGPQANCRSGPKKEVAPSRGGRIVRHSALLQKHVGGRA